MFIRYVGTSDYREFTAADFKKLGAEANKTRFVQHEVVEVPDDTGQMLLESELIPGEFEEVEPPQTQEDLLNFEIEAHENQSESLRQAETGGGEPPATTQRSGGATDAPSGGTPSGTTGNTTSGTTGGTGRRGSSTRTR